MAHGFAEIAFTPTVKRVQQQMGSRASYAHFEAGPETRNRRLSDTESGFIGGRDSFYIATVSETGWPYIQHRGGPTGFVRILNETTIGFADFRGNRQYVSVGNLMTEDRVSLFFMDYVYQKRLKLFGRAKVVDLDDQATLSRLEMPDYRARVERGLLIDVDAFDWNCPQHITPRLTHDEIGDVTAPLTSRIAELEAELARRSSPHG